jgi:hypothetical protein
VKLFFGAGIERPVRAATDLIEYLPIDKRHHYCDGFSMAEAAKSWVVANGLLPSEIAGVVGSDELNRAHFEFPTVVWGGGTAMTDVMAFLPRGIVAVEAKVDETFDDIVSVWVNREKTKRPRSPEHRHSIVQRYADALGVEKDVLMTVRYQLLQRTLCASIVARNTNVSDAWMIVQSFPSTRVGIKNENRYDFERFVDLVGDKPTINGVQVRLAWASRKQA